MGLIHFIKYRKIFYLISGSLVALSIFIIVVFGLRFGIEFTGGTIIKIEYENTRPSVLEIKEKLREFPGITIQEKGNLGIILEMKEIPPETQFELIRKLKELGEIKEGSLSVETIGPVIGKEMRQKTLIVIVLSLFAVLIYIAIAFSKASRPVNSFIYGVMALIALCHDVIIPLGVFSILGKYFGVKITIPIITAFLFIFGYSINDTIVIFDRTRENLLKFSKENFDVILDKSLSQTLSRSLSISFTTLIPLFAIFFFGGETLKYFVLALILGISFGSYSSIFLAAPLVYSYFLFREKKKG